MSIIFMIAHEEIRSASKWPKLEVDIGPSGARAGQPDSAIVTQEDSDDDTSDPFNEPGILETKPVCMTDYSSAFTGKYIITATSATGIA